MHRLNYGLLTIILLFFFPSSLSAQTVTVTSGDYLNYIGTTVIDLVGKVDSSQTPSVDLGLPGENQTWDLRNIAFTDTILEYIQQSLNPQQTIYADSFPRANYAKHTTENVITPSDTVNDFESGTEYYEVTSTNLIDIGGSGSVLLDTSLIYKQDTTALPVTYTYGDTWTTVSRDSQYIPSLGGPILYAISIDSTVNTVDGYGTIKLPMGDFECIRVKSYDMQITNEVSFGVKFVTRYIAYSWVSKQRGIELAGISSQANETNPNFTNPFGFSRIESINNSTVAIRDRKKQPNGFKLFQNYPNPFNPTTRISFIIPKQGYVTLSVYNSLGQKVATLVNEVKQSGSYEVNFDGSKFPSGIYFYRLTTEKNILTKKMILLK